MKQEDKELLLKDFCARLPYKPYIKTAKCVGYVYAINISQLVELSVANDSEYWSEVFNIDKIKPYLRPMSSMTEEEYAEYSLCEAMLQYEDGKIVSNGKGNDFLNKNHFDYRGLIPKGLAIEVTKENNPYKE